MDELNSCGRYIGPVGYRTVDGSFLARSSLPRYENEYQCDDNDDSNFDKYGGINPGLLFVSEGELISALARGGNNNNNNMLNIVYNCEVEDVILSGDEYKLQFTNTKNNNNDGLQKDCSEEESSSLSSPSPGYDMIIVADGAFSKIRRNNKRQFPATTTSTAYNMSAYGIEDRGYTIFRGNASLSDYHHNHKHNHNHNHEHKHKHEQISTNYSNGASFQTWGDGQCMRFAACPMMTDADAAAGRYRYVWFATMETTEHDLDLDHNNNNNLNSNSSSYDDDDSTKCYNNAANKKELLLNKFGDWHDPIGELIRSTAEDAILCERAIGHLDVHNNVHHALDLHLHSPTCTAMHSNSANDPILVFAGDADYCIDPVLAQGFSIGLEDAASIGSLVRRCAEAAVSKNEFLVQARGEVHEWNKRKETRLKRVLNATALVQILAQPGGGDGDGAALLLRSKMVQWTRKCMRVTPDFVMTPAFDAMMRYSVGL